MTKVKTKRKRPRKWLLVWHRAVGEFDKNNERRMMISGRYLPLRYPSEAMAMRRQAKEVNSPLIGFRHREGNKPKRITEILVFDEEGYSGE